MLIITGGRYVIECDGYCDTRLPSRATEAMAFMIATNAGWLVRVLERKFSGVASYDYCPRCRVAITLL